MASQDYLIAIALIDQNSVRAMPLGGKEIKDNFDDPDNFKKLGQEVIFINIFWDFCRALFIMARFTNTRKLEMF